MNIRSGNTLSTLLGLKRESGRGRTFTSAMRGGARRLSYFGIRGFETVLRGGIPSRAAVLLLAPEGSARHLLGAHFVVEGLRKGERVLVVLAGEPPAAFVARLGRMGVDTANALASASLVVVDWHTAWTQPVEGVEQAHLTVRASRNPEDLLSAVERALPALLPASNRRAFIDVLPVALKAYDEAGALHLITSLRARFADSQVTCVFAADRTMPEAQVAAIAQEWHAVLDAKPIETDVYGLAVLTVGGVPLTPRYRRARIREDVAAVEVEVVRTFSCPICDARVPFEADKCPGCGTSRADMARKAQPAVYDYLERLGLEATPERGLPPLREPRPPGRTNGMRPGGAGRVNGLAPVGRTNGLAATGRVNGLAAGRTNGLVNGVQRARAGMTNGLTNGTGFTNGLASRRSRSESRRSRWRLYLVPIVASVLLSTPFFIGDGPAKGLFVIDGSFEEWKGVAGYTQPQDADVPDAVDLVEYKVVRGDAALYLYARVEDVSFSGAGAVHAFLDKDANRSTGYAVEGLGAEYLVTIEGSSGVTTLRLFSGNDSYNWTAWTASGSVSAAIQASEIEVAIPWDWTTATDPTILLIAEDEGGNRSFSAAFGIEQGVLRATVRAVSTTLARGTPNALAVDLQALGGTVKVTSIDVLVENATIVQPAVPITVAPGPPVPLLIAFDTSGRSNGTLVAAEIRRIAADRPVTIIGGPLYWYVGSGPSGKRVDGWFGDWGPEIDSDTDLGTVPTQHDLGGFAANRTGDDLFAYVDVRGRLFAGSPAPVGLTRPTQAGGEQASPPGVPVRIVGEDTLRAFVDTNRGETTGLPVYGLVGADLMIEVRGMYGSILTQRAFEWQSGWVPIAAPDVRNDLRRLEASIPVPGAGAIEIAFEASSWRGTRDTTEPAPTRGVQSAEEGALRSNGRYAATFHGIGRVELAARDVQVSWYLPTPSGATAWTMVATPVGATFVTPEVEVRYAVEATRLKEDIVLRVPPASSTLQFPFELGGRAMAYDRGDGAIEILNGDRRAFRIEPPFALDARGAFTALSMDLDLDAGLLRIPLSEDLVRNAAYPLVVDPVVNYTLENDGPSTKADEHMGFSVAIGDFNGDGNADVLSGAPDNNLGGTAHGYAYIHYGPFSAGDTTPDVWINGTTSGAQAGYSVAAGKFNNDIYWDALVARRSVQTFSIFGNVSIYYGSAGWSGLETTPDVNFTWPTSPAQFGWAVAAGNVDNADYDDVLIGEPGRDDDGGLLTADGAVHLYLSPFGAVESSADFLLLPTSNASGQLGQSIAVGKIDSDAYADVVAGEPLFSTNAGRVQFYKGISFASGSGNRYPNATLSNPGGGGSNHQFGKSVSVGTINTGAYADLAVGAPRTFSEDGRVYVFLANSDGSGLTTGASPTATLAGSSTGENIGTTVALADWDDDGTLGVLTGAPLSDIGGTNRGRVYWFDSPDTDQTIDLTFEGTQDGERMGTSLAGGRFASDTRTIVVFGAYLWDDTASSENNQGRVVVASVPEPAPLLVAVVVGFGILAVRSRRGRQRDMGRHRHSRGGVAPAFTTTSQNSRSVTPRRVSSRSR